MIRTFVAAAAGILFVAGCGGGGGSGLSSTSATPLLVAPLAEPAPQPKTTATSLATAPNGSPTVTPSITPTPTPTSIPVGSAAFVTRWGLELSPSETCAADLSQAIAVHATVIRVQYLPAQQPKRCYDATFAAAQAHNFRVVWITPGMNLNAPIDTGAYAQTMATGSATYPGGIWEIMNEPDVVQPTLDRDWPNEQLAVNEYVALAQATALAIHAADRTATVLSGGTSGIDVSSRALPWMKATVNLAPLIDGVGFHPYAGYDTGQFTGLQSLFKKPVYVTEWQTNDGGIIESVLDAFNGKVPLFVYCSLACAATSASPIFP